MDFFTKMEMRCERVLSEMDEQVSNQDDERSVGAVSQDRIGREIEERNGDHEAGRERHHVVERADAPAGVGDDRGRTDYVSACCYRRVDESGSVHALLIESLSAAAATASLNAGAGARSHDCIPHSRSSSDARSSRFMLVSKYIQRS